MEFQGCLSGLFSRRELWRPSEVYGIGLRDQNRTQVFSGKCAFLDFDDTLFPTTALRAHLGMRFGSMPESEFINHPHIRLSLLQAHEIIKCFQTAGFKVTLISQGCLVNYMKYVAPDMTRSHASKYPKEDWLRKTHKIEIFDRKSLGEHSRFRGSIAAKAGPFQQCLNDLKLASHSPGVLAIGNVRVSDNLGALIPSHELDKVQYQFHEETIFNDSFSMEELSQRYEILKARTQNIIRRFSADYDHEKMIQSRFHCDGLNQTQLKV